MAATVAAATFLVTLPTSSAWQKADSKDFRSKLSRDQQILHALNRLSYGPRPDDVEAVRKMGVEKWIERQLHPERIPENPILASKLEPLASLQMSSREIVANYPPPQMVVAIATGRLPLPQDPERRAMLERLAARYKQRIDKRDKDKDGQNALVPAERVPLTEILTAEQMRTLRKGSPEEMMGMIQSLPEDKLEKTLYSLPPNARKGLFATAPPEMRRTMLASVAPQQVLAHDLWEAKLYRAVYSERQLAEVLGDFWFNHFNVYLDKGAGKFLTTSYERDAIRPFVLGKFRDMLEATAKHPAMLFYLDNWQSVSPDSDMERRRKRMTGGQARQRGLNENYARELLELHTLGVDGGYTQKDIIEVARCFTGWSISQPYMGAEFTFHPRVHDKGEKTVLGVTIPAGGGMEDGLKVLDIIAKHPSTARFVAKKLAQRFVADNPPDSLVAALAQSFTKSDGDLRAVMQTMLDSREFWSQGAYQAKIKSPLEMVASAARATGAEVNFAFGLAQKIADLGQPLYRKQEPTGYANTSQEWVNSGALLARMNFALALTQNQMPGVRVDSRRFETAPTLIAKSLLFTEASEQTREAINRGLAEKKDNSAIAGLILGSPEFQRK